MPRRAPQDDKNFVHARRVGADGEISALCSAGPNPPEGRIPAPDTAIRVTRKPDRVTCDYCIGKMKRARAHG